jgi:uncharacterized protein YraI
MLKLKLKDRSVFPMVLLPLLLAMASLACNLTDSLGLGPTIEPTPTRTPLPTYTPTPADAAFEMTRILPTPPPPQPEQPQSPPPTPTEPAQPTPPPPDTPTPEPGAPQVTLIQNMNVRSGPGTAYPIAGAGPVGETATVIGRNSDGSWLQVEYPAGQDGTGWLFAELVQVTGSLDEVAVVEVAPPPPPPPTAVPTPEPVVDAGPPPEPEKNYQFTPTGWHASENAAICHFKGRIKDEGGNLVNGYSVYVTNGSWGTVSHPTGASVWYPGIGDGEWNVAGIQLNNCPGGWWITVVKYECDFNAGFEAQCKNFTRLSEDIKVEVVYPEETVINGDWTCHWDCDKGLYVQGYRQP